MALRTHDDSTAKLEAATPRLAWHERPPVLIASALVGMVGLGALVFSVVNMSEESTRPVVATPSALSTSAPEPSPTSSPVLATPAEPPLLPPPPPSSAPVPDFAAGPTAEMLVPPTPAEAAPVQVQLPRWLRRLLHQDDGDG
jgi:hypothetical protein